MDRNVHSQGSVSGLIFIAIAVYIIWLALVYSPGVSGAAYMQEAVVGLFVAAAVAGLTYRKFPGASLAYLHPRRLANLVVYFFVFIWEMIKANLNMARIVLSPRLPIKPGIVEIRTDLSSDAARLLLGNSITLTPGTMTMEVSGDRLYIHWVAVCDDLSQAGAIIKGSFERWLKGVFS